jgi:hypothetical protein
VPLNLQQLAAQLERSLSGRQSRSSVRRRVDPPQTYYVVAPAPCHPCPKVDPGGQVLPRESTEDQHGALRLEDCVRTAARQSPVAPPVDRNPENAQRFAPTFGGEERSRTAAVRHWNHGREGCRALAAQRTHPTGARPSSGLPRVSAGPIASRAGPGEHPPRPPPPVRAEGGRERARRPPPRRRRAASADAGAAAAVDPATEPHGRPEEEEEPPASASAVLEAPEVTQVAPQRVFERNKGVRWALHPGMERPVLSKRMCTS